MCCSHQIQIELIFLWHISLILNILMLPLLDRNWIYDVQICIDQEGEEFTKWIFMHE